MQIRTLSDYCREVFGTKLYRLSLTSGCSCPNRDGTLGYGGCSFCSEQGSGEFAAVLPDIHDQIEAAKQRVAQKLPKGVRSEEQRYIAYFQSFTNTYGDTARLVSLFEEVLRREDIAALSIGTRPDCLKEDMLEALERLNRSKPVWIELGLQTIHVRTALRFNRGYALECFAENYSKLKRRGIAVIVHVILGLPGESPEDMYETVRYLASLCPQLDGIKLHGLHILRGTRLAAEYLREPFHIMSLPEYTEVLIHCLKLLPETVVIHRMTGDGDKRLLIEPQWSGDKKRVLNYINRALREAKRDRGDGQESTEAFEAADQ